MKDIQNSFDNRKIQIDFVGIKGIEYPILVMDKECKRQRTIAKISLYVRLPHKFKGTHMSRFIEVLNEARDAMDIRQYKTLLKQIKQKLNSEEAQLKMDFPYFLEKSAPVSGIKSLMKYKCCTEAILKEDDHYDLMIAVNVPVHSLCPCSKEISKNGAHNQRGNVKISVRPDSFIWLEELIEIAEKSASAPIFALLKREDEKYITEEAYNNPAFVEDIVRNVAVKLSKDKRVKWYKVESENFESIHNHNAYACIVSK